MTRLAFIFAVVVWPATSTAARSSGSHSGHGDGGSNG
jgi:hypothetical protein